MLESLSILNIEGDLHVVITLAGMIGVGKTTYTKLLAEELDSRPIYESVDDNPMLDLYYEDPKKYGFAFQIHSLNTRFKNIKTAFENDKDVLDRSIYEDEIFTRLNVKEGNISEQEYQIYVDLVQNMMEETSNFYKKAPDLMIYLRAPFDHILKNIEKRGRSFEQVDTHPELLDYYRNLYDMYDGWFEEYHHGPKLSIDVEVYDVLENKDDWNTVYHIIKENLN